MRRRGWRGGWRRSWERMRPGSRPRWKSIGRWRKDTCPEERSEDEVAQPRTESRDWRTGIQNSGQSPRFEDRDAERRTESGGLRTKTPESRTESRGLRTRAQK